VEFQQNTLRTLLNIAEIVELVDRKISRKSAINVAGLLIALLMDIADVVKEHEIDAFSYFSKLKANYFDTIFLSVIKERFIDTIITNDSHFEELKDLKVIKPLDYSLVL